MSNVMLTAASIETAPRSLTINTNDGANESLAHMQNKASSVSQSDNCSAYAYRHYHSHNYDVYNSDGVVIVRDT